MKQVLLIVALAMLVAVPASAYVPVATETFAYVDGNLNGNGPWTGSAGSEISVTPDETVMIVSNASGTKQANWSITPYAGVGGKIYVSFDYQMALGNPEFYADVFAKDAAGNYLGWMYVAPEGYWDNNGEPTFANGIVRGRGPDGIVVYNPAAGDHSWHTYTMIIDTVANSTRYYVDGNLIGTRNQAAGVGDSLSLLQLTSWNRGHSASFGYFDNLGYGGVPVPEPSSLLALSAFGLGMLGYIKRRR